MMSRKKNEAVAAEVAQRLLGCEGGRCYCNGGDSFCDTCFISGCGIAKEGTPCRMTGMPDPFYTIKGERRV